MAITHRDTQQATGTTSATVTKPTGTVDGDLLFAVVKSGSAPGLPAGWTTIRTTSVGFVTLYRVASGEPANYEFTGTTNTHAIVSCFAGVATSTPLDVESGAQNASSTAACAPGVTTTQDNDLLVFACGSGVSYTTTPPDGMTEPTNGDSAWIELAYLLDAGTAGATGDKTGTLSTANSNQGHLAAFKIAPPVTFRGHQLLLGAGA